MKKLLLSIAALAVAAAPVFGEDRDEHKQPKNKNTPQAPQRQGKAPPRSYTPRGQQKLQANTPQVRNKPTVTTRTYPRSYTPDVQARIRTRQNFTPPNQDTPRTVTPNTTVTDNYWRDRNRNRTNTNVVTNQ